MFNDILFDNILSIIIAYLLGSIPSALIIGKLFKGIDIRNHGSGNLGATNAIRVLGKQLGLIVAIMDVLKGATAVLLATYSILPTTINPLLIGIVAAVGHVFPIFAKFRGGKAVATSAGIVLAYNPIMFVSGLIIFFITLFITRYVSVSSSVVGLAVFIMSFIFKIDGEFDVYLIITMSFLFLFIILRHIPNYKRLINGTESKAFVKKNNK